MTKRKDPKDLLPRGAPKAEYQPEFAPMLLKHMEQGYTFGSFGAIVRRSRQVMLNWAKEHPEFEEARKEGEALLEKHYTDMGKAIAMGQLRRISKEEPVLDAKGKPVLDPEGKVVMKREYEHVPGNATAWIFLTKNILGWRNENHLHVQASASPANPAESLTPEERAKEIKQMMEFLKETQEGPPKPVIDVTPKKRA